MDSNVCRFFSSKSVTLVCFSVKSIDSYPCNILTGINPCGENNGGCSHLCLIAPGGKNYTCACPDSFVLVSNNNRSCTANCSLSEIRCGAVDDRYVFRRFLFMSRKLYVVGKAVCLPQLRVKRPHEMICEKLPHFF